jgi:hypothetical protein
MPALQMKVRTGARGASLAVSARRLRDMDGRTVKNIFKRHLEDAARPYPARVRASILAIPVKPEGKTTGLRARIASCVELSSGTDADSAYASVWVNPFRMRPDYVTLPLYMQGVEGRAGRDNRGWTRWRHPVYGNRDVWRGQASHPYFYQAVTGLDRAAAGELQAALEDVTRKLNG